VPGVTPYDAQRAPRHERSAEPRPRGRDWLVFCSVGAGMALVLVLGQVPEAVAASFGVVVAGLGLGQMYLRTRLLGGRRNKR
jgi:hypothetical protein